MTRLSNKSFLRVTEIKGISYINRVREFIPEMFKKDLLPQRMT